MGILSRPKFRAGPALLTIALAGALAGFPLVSAPSHAVPGGVQVSDDGVNFGDSYPGALFDSISLLVPGDSMTETLYVRNIGSESGVLRVTLRDVVVADVDFANALTVSASTVGKAGTAATINQADPCWVLSEGQIVRPGQTIRVLATLNLSDLDGQAGQGATAALGMGIALSSAVAPLPATHCGLPSTIFPLVPSGGAVQAQPVQPAIPDASSSSDDGSSVPGASPPDLPVLGLPDLLGIDPNTWQLFEEYLVLILIGAFILGTGWFAFVAWRRRHNEDDQESELEGAAG